MPAFSGKVRINQLYDALASHLKSSAAAVLWTPVNEAETALSLTSTGISGTDNLFVKLDAGNSKSATGNQLVLTVTDLISEDGMVSATRCDRNVVVFSAAVDTNLLCEYDLSVTKDRIILCVKGDPYANNNVSMIAYAGLFKRYSSEMNSMAQGIGVSYQGDNGFYCLQDITAQQYYNVYQGRSVIVPLNPGWGTLYNGNPVILANMYEGARGELLDILALHYSGVTAGDQIKMNSKEYKVLQLTTNGSSFLPSTTVAVCLA
ncbi:hypothetical protein [Paenibacillus sp. P32E]|uniref:hypothetical protein n=1 Tax=Paenibacillus sp. P32E TaxID=1349434 RepID=UPI00093E1A34|nr:hypothetical protein [Paenibacillus sp. P32E]OKP93687.1 hypothetical protein A3848_04040 [Paenibacillus sp. P32E]